MGLEHLCGGLTLVCGKIIEDDDGPRFQFRDQDLFDIRIETPILFKGFGWGIPKSLDL